MKKLFLLSFLLMIASISIKAQYYDANGNSNSIENTDNGSAIGYGTRSGGSYSFAAGYESRAAANGSFAFGKNTVAENQFGFALGTGVVSSADYAWIIGSGYAGMSGISNVSNGFANSLFIGFNSTGRPSLFVEPFDSDGEGGGFVGIHTTDPKAELHVNGSTITTKFMMTDGASPTTDGFVLTYNASDGFAEWTDPSSIGGGSGGTTESYWTASNNNIFFKDAGTFGNNTGRVGIGTDEPEARLHVQSDGWKAIFQGSDGYIMIGPSNSSWAHIYTDRPKFIFNKDIYTITGGLSSYNGGDLFLKTTGTNRITILNSNGNVGIGTDVTPTGKLHVFGEIKSTDYYQFDQANGEIRYGKADLNSTFKIRRYKDGNSGKSEDPDYWKDVLVIDDMERIGIGTDTPGAELDVDGTIKTENFQLTSNGTTGGYVLTDSDGSGNAVWTDIETMSGVGVWDVTNNVAHYSEKVAVNTNYVPDGFEFAVNGDIICEKIEVKLENNWPDYVFEEDYKLLQLSEIESFVKENKHLPGVPTAEEVKENGQDLGEMNTILLQKIEELTLLMIEQQKSIEKQQIVVETQQKEIDALKKQVNQ